MPLSMVTLPTDNIIDCLLRLPTVVVILAKARPTFACDSPLIAVWYLKHLNIHATPGGIQMLHDG